MKIEFDPGNIGYIEVYPDSNDALTKVKELEEKLEELQQMLDRLTVDSGLSVSSNESRLYQSG
jgi:hypothetical protein